MKVKEGKSQESNSPILECLGVDCAYYASQQDWQGQYEYCLAHQKGIAGIKDCRCYNKCK